MVLFNQLKLNIILKQLNNNSSHLKNCKFLIKCLHTSNQQKINQKNIATEQLVNPANIHTEVFDFKNNWPTDVKNEFLRDMVIIEGFINESEEHILYEEAHKSIKRTPYEYAHWDDAIHGYREMEKQNWLPECQIIINRIVHRAFVGNVQPQVHILDLAQNGIIKPHVDSSRYCGNIIAGLSLLSNCIMRLKRVDENKYYQGKEGVMEPCQPNMTAEQTKVHPEFDYSVDILLNRRSLYIMKDTARYKFTHEILPSDSSFKDREIEKNRRISIICRNEP